MGYVKPLSTMGLRLLHALKFETQMKIPVVVYHDVLPSGYLSRQSRRGRFYSISSKTFEDHLRFLRVQGFHTVRMGAFPPDVGHPIVLTFDDGFQSAYCCHHSLINYGFNGTFFIVTDFVGQRPYLSWDEIREMDSSGMSIQSHTCTHPILSAISEDRMRTEFSVSKAILEDKLGHKIDSLSIPQGFANRKVIDIGSQCGYEYIFTSRPGLYVWGSRVPIPRLTIYNQTTKGSFCHLVRQSAYEIAKQRGRKLILSVPKRLLGASTYHRVRLQILQWFDN
jgi:hypothetical protein